MGRKKNGKKLEWYIFLQHKRFVFNASSKESMKVEELFCSFPYEIFQLTFYDDTVDLVHPITDNGMTLGLSSVEPMVYLWGWGLRIDGYRQASNISRTLVGYKLVEHSDAVGASLIILHLTPGFNGLCKTTAR